MKSSITHIMVEITSLCNYRCPVCEVNYGDGKFTSMTEEFGLRVIRSLIDDGIESMSFTGGEPTINWNELLAFLSYCSSSGVHTRLFTNCTLLNKDRISKLESCLDDIVVSFDSLDPNTLKAMRGSCDDVSLCMDNLAILSASKISTIVNTICSEVNYKDLPQLANKLEDLGIKNWWVQQFKPRGRGGNNKNYFGISEEKFLRIIDELRSSQKIKITFYCSESPDNNRVYVDCSGEFINYSTREMLGKVLDPRVRRKILFSKEYKNKRR